MCRRTWVMSKKKITDPEGSMEELIVRAVEAAKAPFTTERKSDLPSLRSVDIFQTICFHFVLISAARVFIRSFIDPLKVIREWFAVFICHIFQRVPNLMDDAALIFCLREGG